MADRGNQIWVDADACPVALKDMLFKAANRAQVRVTLVANQPLQVPTSPYIQFRQVARGFDVADNEIHQRVNRGDLVITGDIPLAADVIDKGRSEERRVGKECRSRWSPEQQREEVRRKKQRVA